MFSHRTYMRQAGAELCQAQAQVKLKVVVEVEFGFGWIVVGRWVVGQTEFWPTKI